MYNLQWLPLSPFPACLLHYNQDNSNVLAGYCIFFVAGQTGILAVEQWQLNGKVLGEKSEGYFCNFQLVNLFKVTALKNGPLQLIRQRSASPRVCKSGLLKDNANKLPVDVESTRENRQDSNKLKLRINVMPPQIINKSSAGKRLPPLDASKTNLEKTGKDVRRGE